jgi:dephospho-CoA kinase
MPYHNKNIYKIGITGGIACGKSLVRKILDELSVSTIDAVEIVHDLLKYDTAVIKKIVNIFGDTILSPEGSIDRKELGKLVFKDHNKLILLENILHPETFKVIDNFLLEATTTIVAAVIPLLFEKNRQNYFDSVWVVTSTETKQLERLKLRDNMFEEEAGQRIAVQMPQDMKIEMADVVIDNNDTIEELEKTVKSLIDKLKKKL